MFEVSLPISAAKITAQPNRKRPAPSAWLLALAGLCLAAFAIPAGAVAPKGYQQTNLISNGAVEAKFVDKNFIDPWGVSIGTDFWINTTVTGLDYIAGPTGAISFTVTIPSATGTGTGTPTGTVFSGTVPKGTFLLPDKSSPFFLFCSIDGTVSGWSGGGAAQITVNNHKTGHVYTDMALLTNTKGTYILLANFGAAGGVEVYDGSYKRTMATAFKDPTAPAAYAPYGVHVFNGTVYVTYAAKRGPQGQDNNGPGKGFVDSFDLNGKFLSRIVPVGNHLNAPWGMAIAPATFGQFANDILVGNFADGTISAYDPKTHAYRGQIADGNGNVIANPGLWEIVFGQTDPAVGDPNTLYIAAGLNNESAGLFAAITPASAKITKTKTSVTSDGNPGSKGEKLTFTALVQPVSGFGEPEGKVAFTVDGKALKTSPVDSTAHATATASNLALGKHTVTAAYSGDANFAKSAGSMTETIATPQAAAPGFSPAVGTFTTAQSVTLTDATPHAAIHYTINGTAPTAASPVYSKPISVSTTTTIKAFATATGFTKSVVSSGTFTISVNTTATPVFTPASGTFTTSQLVTMVDASKGAVIYYTTDGTAPKTTSPVYSKAISVPATMTIHAMAVAPGMAPSTVTVATYTINGYTGYTAPPTISPAGGVIYAATNVALADTTGKSVIYYTTDGSAPTTKSAVYTKPIAVGSSMTINAMAVAPGMSPSTVAKAAYTYSTGGGGW